MGCCGSSEAVAPESELAPPEWGKPYKVSLKKIGMLSADYNVFHNEGADAGEGEKWMLLDAVGSIWDSGYNYFLKHRPAGLVDDEGKPKSNTLGSVNIKGEWDCFSFRVLGRGADFSLGPMFDWWDGDIDWGVSHAKEVRAAWTYSKRAILYSDYEMTQQVGFLDITGSGTYYE